MALTIKNKFVREKIVDEEGKVLGELVFNPSDTRIMQKLTKIMNDLGNRYKDIKKIEKETNLSDIGNIDDVEDFEKASEAINKLSEAFTIQNETVENVIKDLEEIFTKDTVRLFTGGTNDFEALYPLLEFIAPYVSDYKKEKISQYLVDDGKNDVMD